MAVVTPRTLHDMKRDTVRARAADDRARPRRAFPQHPPRAATSLDGLRAACASAAASAAFGHAAAAPRGVRTFRSISEADEHGQAWEEAAMRRTAAGRAPHPG